METDYEFEKGDSLLCYSANWLYGAKCLDRRNSVNYGIEYLVHYKNFNSKFDEWVHSDYVLEVNEINIKHKKRLITINEEFKRTKKNTANIKKKPPTKQPSRKRGRPKTIVQKAKKNKIDPGQASSVQPATQSSINNLTLQAAESCSTELPVSSVDELEPIAELPVSSVDELEPIAELPVSSVDELEPIAELTDQDNELDHFDQCDGANILDPTSMSLNHQWGRLQVPIKLKFAYVFDWVFCNSFKKVSRFLKNHFIDEVIDSFVNSHSASNQNRASVFKFGIQLMHYFNEIVHTHLLYANEISTGLESESIYWLRERQQNQTINSRYKDFFNPKNVWCFVYGPRHLLRLLIESPRFKLPTDSECDKEIFYSLINDLLEFMEINYDTYFNNDDLKI